ncbi:hypothetical protein BgAZ_401980 [Babesia gibsoni]|uniref:rRNA maturation factor n=1 Tax=Babesia gibsoni TaxID=33632 RepID=A0AAD8LIQ1_BABGI|nr:hypothetical protein BgAZ_401980 [Babesia gibsoni]
MPTDVCSVRAFFGLIFAVAWTGLTGPATAECFRASYRNLPLLYQHHVCIDVRDPTDAASSVVFPHGRHRPAALCLQGSSEVLKPNDITVDNAQEEYYINKKLIHDACSVYRSTLGLDDFSVDVLFMDNDSMCEENKETFGKDSPTDIISHADNTTYTKKDYHLNRTPLQVPELRHLGAMILCPDYIKKQMVEDIGKNEGEETDDEGDASGPRGVAERMKGVTDLNLRFCYLLAHGFLHLLGYDHVKDDDFDEMLAEEDRLLDAFLSYYNQKYRK